MASEPSDAAWKRFGTLAAAALTQLAYDRADVADRVEERRAA